VAPTVRGPDGRNGSGMTAITMKTERRMKQDVREAKEPVIREAKLLAFKGAGGGERIGTAALAPWVAHFFWARITTSSCVRTCSPTSVFTIRETSSTHGIPKLPSGDSLPPDPHLPPVSPPPSTTMFGIWRYGRQGNRSAGLQVHHRSAHSPLRCLTLEWVRKFRKQDVLPHKNAEQEMAPDSHP